MKKYISTLIMAVGSFLAVSAQVQISGQVVSNKQKPLYGASITLLGSYDGATSDSLGNFSFATFETGAKTVEISLSGYKTYTAQITIAGSEITINCILKELITELNAVVITAGSFEASDKKKGTVLTSLDIVTTASANADITGALKTLPGTQQVGEQEGLFVRGGAATESKIFIDGNLVNNFFYSSLPGMATRGRFNPFLFKGTVFSSGGYSALYGQALSAALILETNDLPEQTAGSYSVSVIGMGAGIQKLSKNKNASWGLTYNYTNLALAFKLFEQQQDFFTVPEYHDGDINFRLRTKNGMIKYYGYGSWNKLGFSSEDIDSADLQNSFRIKNINTYHNLHWKENLQQGWKMDWGLSYSNNKDNIANELQDKAGAKQMILQPIEFANKNFAVKSKSNYAQLRMVFEKRLKGLSAIRFGGEHFINYEKNTFTAYDSSAFTNTLRDNLTAAFAETDIYLTRRLASKIGGRVEYSKKLQEWNAAPRFSLAYQFDAKRQVSFATGVFYQIPESQNMPYDATDVGFAKASHYILQFQQTSKGRIFRTEAFYKKYNRLYRTASGNQNAAAVVSNNGTGYAKGIELFWRDKKSITNIDYWFSYSYLDTERDYQNFPHAMAPSFAANHTASLVIKKFVLPWKTGFNASYNFASGRPYYHLKYNEIQDNYTVADQGKTIHYNNLSFSLNYLPNLGKKNAKLFSVLVLSVSNVLGQKQVFGYNYSNISDRKIAITPSAKRFVYLGWFVSFGVDRTQDAINNNL